MTFALLVIGILLAAIVSLTTFIFSIIFLSTGKQRKAGLFVIGFIMSTAIGVLCFMEAAKRGKDFWLTKIEKHTYSSWDQESGNYYGYAPSWITDTIPAGYFEQSTEGSGCIPLVYPYRFLAVDPLMTSVSLECYNAAPDSSLAEMKYIIEFSFDTLFLIAKRNNNALMESRGKENDLPDHTYFLLDFRTGNCEMFVNEQRMMAEARKRGYAGDEYLSTVYHHREMYPE